MNTFPRAISTTHEVEFIPVAVDYERNPVVSLDLCPALVMTFTVLKEETAFTLSHVVSPDKGREAWLYPEGNDFARATCEKLSMREK